jgi:hypothetical protein
MPTLRLRPDFEDALRLIQGVRAASVITRGDGQPTEIHVLAAPGRQPKQLVRDVQSLAMAQFDLDIDHRIVSVVQLEDADLAAHRAQPAQPAVTEAEPVVPAPTPVVADSEATAAAEYDDDEELVVDLREREPVGLSVVGGGHQRAREATASSAARVLLLPDAIAAEAAVEDEPAPRPAISSIMVRTSNAESEATVVIGAGGHSFEGRVVGPAGATHRPRLVAQATLAAISDLLGQTAEVDSAQLVNAAGRQVAVTVLTLQTPRLGEQVMSGSAMIRGDEADAVARSVLDALNRRIAG